MYVHADDETSKNYLVLDLDTGEFIGYCQWADDSTGKYCVARVFRGDDDRLSIEMNIDGTVKWYEKQGNIKILVKSKLKKTLDNLDKPEKLYNVICSVSGDKKLDGDSGPGLGND